MQTEQTGQQPVNTLIDEDVVLIKTVFADNDNLLKAMRALFFGLSPTKEEKELIKNTFAKERLRKIMWKRFYPTISRDMPIGQLGDVWLGAESMVFGVNESTIAQAILYKKGSLEMTYKAMELLEDPDKHEMDLTYNAEDGDVLATKLLTRNQYIRHIEAQLLFLKVIAGQKKETLAETKTRLGMDSAK